MSDQLAIITVSYNKKAIHKLLESLDVPRATATLYIVDISGNTDAYPKTKHLTVAVLVRPNRGYAAGVNEGLKAAKKEGRSLYCVINDDTFVAPDFVENTMTSIKDHSNALIGGAIYYAPGYEYHHDRYTKKDLGNVFWYAGGYVDWAHSQPAHRGVDEVDHRQFNKMERTSFITGCLMAFDESTLNRLGYWDESYFLYYEDADYCERAKRKNIPLVYDPSMKIWHLVSQSTDGSGSSLHKKYQRKNLVKFALRYAPIKTKAHILKNFLFGL